MSEGIGEARPEAEGELSLARIAMDGGDLGHAAAHAGNAIAEDPSHRAVYETLEELASRSGDALALFPVTGPRIFIGAVAAHSWLLARTGSVDEAFALLCQVAAVEPDKPWTAGWLDVPGTPVASFAGRMIPELTANSLMRLAAALPDPVPPPRAAVLAPFLQVTRLVAARSYAGASWFPMFSALARRLGAVDEAVAWCEEAERESGSPNSAIMLGYALRSAGRLDAMHDAWVRALRRDHDNVALRVDIGENLARRGRLREGLHWLDEGLALEPDHPKAFPSACEMRYRADGDIAHLVRLADWWRGHPEHEYADTMLTRACDGRPWLSQVPWGSEATANMLRSLAQREKDGEQVSVTQLALSALEVPSVMAAMRTRVPGLRVLGLEPGEDPGTPEPSIRLPVAEGRYRLWEYIGAEALPVPPVPSAAAAGRLRQVAASGYPPHPVGAYDLSMSLTGVSVEDLLGLMVHAVTPPDTPRWAEMDRYVDPSYWRRSAQAWACLGLLHHQADEPWASSQRREVLVDLLRGVEDWATDAAMYALVVAAWSDPACRSDVAGLVTARFAVAVAAWRQRAVTIAAPMAHLVLATPGVRADTLALAREVIRVEQKRDDDAGQLAGKTRPRSPLGRLLALRRRRR